MTRPLINESIERLQAMAGRQWENAAELDLIMSELVHRTRPAAVKLRAAIVKRLSELTAASSTDRPNGEITGRADAHRVGKRAPAKAFVGTAGEFIAVRDGDKAQSKVASLPETASPQEKSSAMSKSVKTQADRQMRDWTYDAVAKLRAKLIDLSRKSPLIALKHSTRSVSQLRFIDERPDLLFGRLSAGDMGFEPLPGEELTPKDERTPQFGIAYERGRLTDPDFLAATEKLGQDEGDARAWQDAERVLRSRVRAALGLPKLDFGKSLDLIALARAHGFDPSYDLKPSDDGDIAAHHADDSIRVLLTRKELDRRLKTIADRAVPRQHQWHRFEVVI